MKKQSDLLGRVVFTNVILALLWIIVYMGRLDLYKWNMSHEWKVFSSILPVLVLAFTTVILNAFWFKLLLTPLEKLAKPIEDIKQGKHTILTKTHLTGGTITQRCINCLESFGKKLDNLTEEHELSQRLAFCVISAQEEERKRIARELHDEASQLLTTLTIRLEHLKLTSKNKEETLVSQEIDELKQLSQHVLVELRRLAFNLRPTMLDNLGLRHALFWLFREQFQKKGVQVKFFTEGTERRLDNNIELALFRVSQEAVTNIVKYANATLVQVKLLWKDSTIVLEISDNGIGFDKKQISYADDAHMGLLGMKERITLLNGTFEIKSAPGSGTTINVVIPLNNIMNTEGPFIETLSAKEDY